MNLYGKISNIQYDPMHMVREYRHTQDAYRQGHRDACHAAAELVSADMRKGAAEIALLRGLLLRVAVLDSTPGPVDLPDDLAVEIAQVLWRRGDI